MTLLFSRPPPAGGPASHAFVIGVGGYPHAKAGAGHLPDLVAGDIPSAADSAKFFCDWLLANRDRLVAPLASLEVLISDTAAGADRYVWNPAQPVDPATAVNVRQAGAAWLDASRVRAGDTLIFYACGHGANLSSEPTLFLGDLNEDSANPWSFVNIQSLGRALRKTAQIECAYLFVDACGETIPGFSLAGSQDTRFWPAAAFTASEAWKVMLLCATPSGVLAHDGAMPGSAVRLGRFTQTLVKALDGALVGEWDGRWAVDSGSLGNQLKDLREFYFPGWSDYPFEPGALLPFNQVRYFVVPENPLVPVRTRVIPGEALAGHALCMAEVPPPPIPGHSPAPFDMVAKVWRPELPPSTTPRYAVVHKDGVWHIQHFTPNKPHFDLKVTIS